MTEEREIGIIVSRHASDRWRERHPEAHLHRDAVAAIFHLVQAALAAGRVSKRKPVWSQFVSKRGGPRNRYCWTEDEQVAFVLGPPRDRSPEQQQRSREFRRRWVVITVLPRQDAEDLGEERRHLTRESIRYVNRQSKSRRAAKSRRRLDTDHHG